MGKQMFQRLVISVLETSFQLYLYICLTGIDGGLEQLGCKGGESLVPCTKECTIVIENNGSWHIKVKLGHCFEKVFVLEKNHFSSCILYPVCVSKTEACWARNVRCDFPNDRLLQHQIIGTIRGGQGIIFSCCRWAEYVGRHFNYGEKTQRSLNCYMILRCQCHCQGTNLKTLCVVNQLNLTHPNTGALCWCCDNTWHIQPLSSNSIENTLALLCTLHLWCQTPFSILYVKFKFMATAFRSW